MLLHSNISQKWSTVSPCMFCQSIYPLEDKDLSLDSCLFGNIWTRQCPLFYQQKLTVSAAWSTLWSVTSGLTCSLCRFFFSWKTPEAPSQPLGDAAERLCRNHPWTVLPYWTTVWWECYTLRLCQGDRVWSLFLRSVHHTWGVSLNCYLWFIGYRL